MPSKEHDGSSIITLRLPDILLERLDRYLDWMAMHRGENTSRNQAIRKSLVQWLEMEEEQGGMFHPDVLRRHFQAAYTSLRSGRDEVDIHRLRHLLGWSADRFDAMVEQLRAESQVALHVGDPGDLNDEERRHSYEVNGQLYVRLSWSA
ncbi:MAG TPA: ribbon-helix-helix domain-containing protein [Terriglobia bacterium]|nr:ribbon-helix-helix domain-containing protein [Terriglobia bacterium]